MNMKTMLKRAGILFIALAVALGSIAVQTFAAEAETAAAESGVPAFPGAEGGGMWATGARGAEKPEVYHVTSLADSGEGSFRDAVSQGNRIVVFDVSGYIDLDSNVTIGHDNMTILGQTAPGDGICFRTNNIKVGANNVILRHLRFRVGSKKANGEDTKAQDGLEITDNCTGVIVDHCSVSWGTDENLSAYAVKDVTIQYSIIAEALNQSVHDKGEHGYGGIWGGVNMSVHHNLIATHKSRNPKVGTSESVSMTAGYIDSDTLVDMKNNIIYNWGDKAGYGTENGAKTYIQNNIYKPGPATPAGKRARIFELSVGQKHQANMLGSVYAVGNKIDVDKGDPDYTNAQKVNENNWQDDLHTGVYVDTKFYNIADTTNMVITTPDAQYQEYNSEYPITVEDVDSAYDDVLANAGATLPKRDKVDERIINDVETRTAPNGVKGSIGLVDDPLDGIPAGHEGEYDGRGYPLVTSETRAADYDADADGIADAWEDAMGLDKTNKNDSLNIGPDGYTWLEIFVEESITDGKTPAGLTISAEDKYYTTSDTITVKADEGGANNSNSWVTSYENGVVTVDPSAQYDKAVAVAASYDANSSLIDSKSAEVDKSTGTANVGTVAAGAVTKVFLWNSLNDIEPLCEPYTVGGSAGDITDVEIYCNDTPVAQAENTDGVWTANITGLPTGDNALTAKATMSDGSYSLSSIKTVHVTGAQAAEGWTAAGGASFDGENYTLPAGSTLTTSANGDFKLVARIDEVSNLASGVNTGITAVSGSYDYLIGKRYNSEFEQEVYYGGNNSIQTLPNIDAGAYTLFEISRSGNQISLYAGTSLADLETEPLLVSGGGADAYTIGAEADGTEMTVSKLSMLKRIETTTNPKVEITNIKNNDRIDVLGSSVEAKITADGTPVTEVWVYFNDAPIASAETYITGEETVSIPISFSEPTAGSLTVYAFDENLCSGSASVEVSVSMDSAPWILADIGYAEGQPQTYAQVTPDYTFKLYSAPGGQIGGTNDRFGYMYQRFTGNNRMYYRSRLQSSSQFGVVFRKDLDTDGVEYYFGGDTDESGAIIYKLMKRASKGGALELVEDLSSKISGQNLYFIAEKAGDKINIYQTENGTTVYTTKTPLVSVDAPELGDTYLMGFAETGRNAGDFADSGWVALEAFDDADTQSLWNLDNGLDWRWQIQDTAPTPTWDGDNTFDNATGKMKITTDSNYTDEGYIIHEYIPQADMITTGEADVLVSGEGAGLNLYMNVGADNKAFKVTFSDDNLVYFGDAETNYEYSQQQWYHVKIEYNSVLDSTAITLTDADGTVCAESSASLVDFRSCTNTKRTNITDAVFIEPFANTTATYYIDNVSVTNADPGVKVERETNWYTFKDVEALSGAFTVEGTTLPDGGEPTGTQMSVDSGAGSLATKGYDVAKVHFAKRIRLNKNKAGALTVPVKSGSTVYVYCASANSSSERSMYINNVEYKVQAGTALEYNYTGDDGTIEIYAGDGIDVYGVCVEKVTITPKN